MTYKVNQVNWRSNSADIKSIREKVFVCEYRIPQSSEFDKQDSKSEHVLLRNERGDPIATGRICEDGKISRIAVLRNYRGSEAGKRVIGKLLDIAKARGLTKVYIDSGLDDVDKYRQLGFSATGSVYMDSGVAKQPLGCRVEQFRCLDTILH